MRKTLIFDLDGTLLDSMHVWDHLGEKILHQHGCVPKPDLQSTLAQMTLQEACGELQTYLPGSSKSAILAEIQQQLQTQYANELLLKNGALQALHHANHMGYPIVIATANNLENTKQALTHTNAIGYVEAVITCEEVRYSKRDPAFYTYVAAKCHRQPQDCILLDDTLHAIQAANKVGMITFGMYDASSAADWSKICTCADHSFFTMEEMEEFLCIQQYQ